MGKLGGGELNFSSDIDILFVYRPSQEGKTTHAHGRAIRWARQITSVLERVTEEGPAFRVDLGLRPGGKDGDIAIAPEAAELYYQTQASPWERWALLKAHPVAGDAGLGSDFIDMVRPFVYRKYLDYASLEDIRELKNRIQREIRWRRSIPTDVKMGEGGIRELEFLVQTLQIIYGGKLPQLRRRDTLGVLDALVAQGLFPEKEGKALRDAYLFLRGVEHRVQMVQHRQLHQLPPDEKESRRISWLMGYEDAEGHKAFMRDLRLHMETVHGAFDGLLEAQRRTEERETDPSVEAILVNLEDEDNALALLQGAGFQRPQAARASLQRILTERFPAHRSRKARRILNGLLPRILFHVRKTALPDQTLFRLETFLEAVGPRGGYYALLEENPKTLEMLIALFGQSALLSRWLGTHLEAVDALIGRGHHQPRRQKEDLRREIEETLATLDDPEERLGRLREFRAQEILRIGVSDLWGVLNPLEVGEELTNLAEVFLEITLQEALRFAGHDPTDQGIPLCIMGLGSLGGRELSYRSDLDIIFVYDGGTRQSTAVVNRVEHITRIGQRVLAWITMPMKEGPGWPIDLRLRPSGSRGPLMVSLTSFERYYREQARAWELQALLKARLCSGSRNTGEQVMETICQVLTEASPPDAQAYHDMRMRLERERGTRASDGSVHLKLGTGGEADIEFLVQYLQMERWARDPGVRTPITTRALGSLVEAGALSQTDGHFLLEAHRFFRGIGNRLGLVLDHKGTDHPCTQEDLTALEPLEGIARPASIRQGEDLPGQIKGVMAHVREIYLRNLLGSSPL
jgi:glutamate-ammonia-ligase adenylyltransferase